MWWIILIIVILIILLIVIAVIASNSNNSCNKPCTTEETEKLTVNNNDICGEDNDATVLLSCGDEVQLKTCDSHGRIGNYQYYRVHKGQKTYIPFRPTRINGNYKTCMITYGKDEVDYVIIHKKEDGELKPLPTEYRKVYVVIY